jgi:hypothetical protein
VPSEEDQPPGSGKPEKWDVTGGTGEQPEGAPPAGAPKHALPEQPDFMLPPPYEPGTQADFTQPLGYARDQDEPTPPSPAGSMTFQDAATARPRPPTPAELRAREKFAKKQQEIEEARLAAEAKRRKRNRTLIGAGVAVGVVGVVAGLGYWALSAPTVYAQCVQDDTNGQPVIVPDNYCTSHTAGMNGFFFFGGHQYRYYYGSSGSIGSRPMGGSTTAPSGSTIKTRSGTTISRGGLGGKFGGGGS